MLFQCLDSLYFFVQDEIVCFFKGISVMTTLSKSELISHISKTTKLSSTDVDSVVNTLFDTITETLKSGGEVKFLGFGSFAVQSSAAREGRNPRTGNFAD